jgi:peptidoglycan/xylan/chitin deacetylase (PgdA/CDA1 family)
MTGQLVISLDFELMWGVRDHRSVAEYGDAVLGARAAIPQMLSLFSAYGIRATWATVGFLFARNRSEILDHMPAIKAAYETERASPYVFVGSGLGEDEREDPWHFGRSLVERIAETDGQEIGSHSFSHFCCLEPGHSPNAFAADLIAARSISRLAGYEPKSIVFARNQYSEAYARVAADNGFAVYRGNPNDYASRPRSESEKSTVIRVLKLYEDATPWARQDRGPGGEFGFLRNVRASRFLRPFSRKFPLYSAMHLRKVKAELRQAAATGTTYHLWWHPHNMGRNTARNMHQLEAILREFRRLQDVTGLRSTTMLEAARQIGGRP